MVVPGDPVDLNPRRLKYMLLAKSFCFQRADRCRRAMSRFSDRHLCRLFVLCPIGVTFVEPLLWVLLAVVMEGLA
jgi:hypothetical protein